MTSCPRCHSEQIHQSRRKGIMERGLLTLLFLRPFLCDICYLRFYRRMLPNDSTPSRQAEAN